MVEGISPERAYAEEFGLLFGNFGFPRMAGRILGWLLICDPPRQSSADLARALGASKGAISTGTRMLLNSRLIDRVGVPGERGHFFEVRPESFTEAHDQIGTFKLFSGLMDKGLAILGEERSPRAERLRVTRDLYRFLEREFPSAVERFWAEEAERKRKGDG